MAKTVFLDFDSTSRGDLELNHLQDSCETLQLWPHTTPKQRAKHIGDAEVVISNKVILDAELLRQFRQQIKLICVAATGTNNIDLDAASRLGIPVTNIRNYASQSVAEHTIGLLFALSRQITAYQQSIQQGAWHRSPFFCLLDHPIGEVAGKTLGLIGYGNLGQATAKLAKAIGMKVIVAERQEADTSRHGRVELDTLLINADVISLHCPLTPDTSHLIDQEQLQRMRPSALLINTARGGIVNEKALFAALKNGTIAGAAVDTLEVEPPLADSPLLQEALPNLIISPHIAWASQQARQTLVDQLGDIIRGWQQGDIINQVNQR